MDETYSQQIRFHSLIICMQLATICLKLQLKWLTTLYCDVAQVGHLEI
jgi:hypothetical protein